MTTVWIVQTGHDESGLSVHSVYETHELGRKGLAEVIKGLPYAVDRPEKIFPKGAAYIRAGSYYALLVPYEVQRTEGPARYTDTDGDVWEEVPGRPGGRAI